MNNLKKKSIILIVLLIATSTISPLNLQSDSFINNVKAYNQISTNPQLILSNNNFTHLIFNHEVIDFDAGMSQKYHMRQLVNNSWSAPKKLFEEVETSNIYISSVLLLQEKTTNGLRLTFFKSGTDRNQGLYIQEYMDESNTWLEPVSLFNGARLYESINLTLEENDARPYLRVQGYSKLNNGSSVLIWEFSQSNNIAPHEYAGENLLTIIGKNNELIKTLTIPSTMGPIDRYFEDQPIPSIFELNGSLAIYNSDFEGKIIYYEDNLTRYSTPLETVGAYKIYIGNNLIFGINQTLTEPTLYLYDLSENCPPTQISDLPSNPKLVDIGDLKIDITATCKDNKFQDINLVSYNQLNFEIYTYNIDTERWTRISSYEYAPVHEYNSQSPKEINFIMRNDSYQIFFVEHFEEWNEQIYYIVYHNDTWSKIYQVTFPDQFTKDYKGLNGFSPFFSILGLLATPILLVIILIMIPKAVKKYRTRNSFEDNSLYPERKNSD